MARGRKSGVVLWRPDVVTERGPIYVSSLRKQPMGVVLQAASLLPDPEYFHDEIKTLSDIYLRWAIADVIRRRWYPKMKIATSEKKGGGFSAIERAQVQAEGLVLSRLLDIAAEVSLFKNGGYKHYAYWWFACIREASTHRLSAMKMGESSPTKRSLLSIYEGQTSKLRERRNPFPPGSSKDLFSFAISTAEEATNAKIDADHFYPSKYIPYLEARSNLAKIVRKKGLDVISKKAVESK